MMGSSSWESGSPSLIGSGLTSRVCPFYEEPDNAENHHRHSKKRQGGELTFRATDANLQRHIELLIEDWFSQPGLRAKKDEGDDVNSFLNCVGFTNAAAECMRSYLNTNPADRIARGILARSIFELGVTCVWLSLTGLDGFEALRWDQQRQKKALANDMKGFDSNEELSQTIAKVTEQEPHAKNNRAEQARYFSQMIKSLDTGATPLYVIYRMYSEYSHASLGVANSYIEEDEGGEVGIYFPARHQALNDHTGTAVAPFVWAVNAVNKMLIDEPFSALLGTMKTLLETGIDFTLKDQPAP
ncbi:DUF5677 domain-containing protein [Pseudarthrobacter sp. H3Y2-7]|uniref:DUF5677 domain-containing protein n=1 Tax=Pseudarthrobacter naphthalenicus TaxID=3031328 RepID=UPI0023AEF54C|nr:DUF5677 domain-containing protein [Pseudarthrobacter sp. H3Y2-7]MDE8670899.1 DUF5677 domain-containing protein [Pseudarthrobacter sp. H3Y2-7]